MPRAARDAVRRAKQVQLHLHDARLRVAAGQDVGQGVEEAPHTMPHEVAHHRQLMLLGKFLYRLRMNTPAC